MDALHELAQLGVGPLGLSKQARAHQLEGDSYRPRGKDLDLRPAAKVADLA
jgi:hypothetical protein